MAIYGYIRVSTVDQADEGESLPTQAKKIMSYAELMDLEPVTHIFKEAGISGSIPLAERPAGKDMFQMLQTGDTVIATKLDRTFRNALDALNTVEFFKRHKISLYLMDMQGDVVNGTTAKLIFTVLAAVAESTRNRIRESIMETQASMREDNRYMGGKLPYECDVVISTIRGAPEKTLVKNAERMENVIQMHIMHRNGLSLHEIGLRYGMSAASIKRILERTRLEYGPIVHKKLYGEDLKLSLPNI